MLHFWLIYRREDAIKNQAYIELYQRYAPEYGIECELVYVENLRYGVKDNQPYLMVQSEDQTHYSPAWSLPDFAIVRTILPSLNKQFELLGVPCLNSYHVSSICNDKAETYRYLAGKGIPMPDTEFIANRELTSYLEHCPAGTILKAVDGHGGSQVCLYDGNVDETLHIIGCSDAVLQPRIGKRNNHDVRVYVIGNKIIAAVLRKARSGFRANFSLGGDVSLYNLTEQERCLVQRIIHEFSFDMVGIDFLIDDDGGFVFNEIEDVVGARMLYQCSDIDIVREYLIYISDRFKTKGVSQ